MRKRDGPAPQERTPSQGQIDERAPPLPQPKIPRKPGRTTYPPHHRSRRRQPQGWRQFRVRIVTKPDSSGATALYAFLRAAAKRFGLEVASVDEITEPPHSDD